MHRTSRLTLKIRNVAQLWPHKYNVKMSHLCFNVTGGMARHKGTLCSPKKNMTYGYGAMFDDDTVSDDITDTDNEISYNKAVSPRTNFLYE